MTEIFNKLSTKEKRRKLRNNMTVPEKLLWKHIRNDSLGVRFRRQYSIGEYIVDFYCPTLRIVIEVDGNNHFTKYGRNYDQVRTEFIESFGLHVIRFNNADIVSNVNGVLEEITKVIDLIKS